MSNRPNSYNRFILFGSTELALKKRGKSVFGPLVIDWWALFGEQLTIFQTKFLYKTKDLKKKSVMDFLFVIIQFNSSVGPTSERVPRTS